MRIHYLLIVLIVILGFAITAIPAEPSGELEWYANPEIQELVDQDQEQADAKTAAGKRCPNFTGKIKCTTTFPVCCKVSGTWGCYAKLSDCKE